MRFSKHPSLPPSDPTRQKGRRKAKFFYALKNAILLAMKQNGVTVGELARLMNKNKSTISRILNPTSNIEAATLFDLAEALNVEWDVRLAPRSPDWGRTLHLSGTDQDIFSQSWGPVISNQSAKAQRAPIIYKTEVTSAQLETTECVL